MTLTIPEITLENILFKALESDSVGITLETMIKAKEGDVESLFEIANRYRYDDNDISKAMGWYQLAANKNYAPAQNTIGYLFHEGKGVPVDYYTAMKWFIKAAKGKDELGIYNVGELFEKGRGVNVDKTKALEWYCRINKHSPDVTRLLIEGYSLTKEQDEKPFGVLVREAEELLEFEEIKVMAMEGMKKLDLKGQKLDPKEQRKNYKIQVDIQFNDRPENTGKEELLEAENRTLRDTCKQMNSMVEVIKQSNLFIMSQFDKKALASDEKINLLKDENREMKAKLNHIENFLQSTGNVRYSMMEVKHDNHSLCDDVDRGNDNTDFCYDSE